MTQNPRAREAGPQKRVNPKTGRVTWGFVIDVGVDGDGNRRQARRRGFATKAEAQAELDKLRNAKRTQSFVAPKRQTVGAYLDEWLATIERTVEPSTWSSYRRYLRLHVRPHIGGVQVQALDAAALNRLYGTLLKTGRHDGRGLSARSVRYLHTIMHRALKDAVREGRVVRNVADAATPPSASSARPPEMRTWTAAELLQFLDAVQGSRYRVAWLVLATTGMRRGEALGLRWRDVDLDAGRLTVRQTVTSVDHKIRIAPRTKMGAGRGIDLGGSTIAELRAHRARQAQELLLLGVRPDGDTLVFCHPDARPYDPDRFSREFDRALERNRELPRIRLHDLRHTLATIALEAGIPVKVLSERLGHANSSVTQNVYQHVSPTMQVDAADRVDAKIFGGGA